MGGLDNTYFLASGRYCLELRMSIINHVHLEKDNPLKHPFSSFLYLCVLLFKKTIFCVSRIQVRVSMFAMLSVGLVVCNQELLNLELWRFHLLHNICSFLILFVLFSVRFDYA